MATRKKFLLWPANGILTAQDTNWFAVDQKAGLILASSDIITIQLSARAFVSLFINFKGIQRQAQLDENRQISQDTFSFTFNPGMTYNIQHTSGGDLGVSCIISKVVSD